MIVIASHNNIRNLERLLKSLSVFGTGYYNDVLIIDTNSDNCEYLNYLDSLKTRKFNFRLRIDKTPYSGYDSGAYIYVYENYVDTEYIFLQDSLEIKNWTWAYEISNKLKSHDVVSWRVFDKNVCPYDSDEQRTWLRNMIGTDDYDWGIFGPIFSIKREAMNKIKDNNLFIIPTSKIEQQGMERGWAIIFKKLNITVTPLENWGWRDNNNTKYFNKHFLERV